MTLALLAVSRKIRLYNNALFLCLKELRESEFNSDNFWPADTFYKFEK